LKCDFPFTPKSDIADRASYVGFVPKAKYLKMKRSCELPPIAVGPPFTNKKIKGGSLPKRVYGQPLVPLLQAELCLAPAHAAALLVQTTPPIPYPFGHGRFGSGFRTQSCPFADMLMQNVHVGPSATMIRFE
jgi:hypothetical protein